MMRKAPDGITPAGETPLESWKQIAAYLQRDVRTAKRWEKSEGLPVHRHAHQARSSVYAYPSELEAWRADRKPGTEAPAAHGPIWRRPAPSAAFGLVLLLGLVSAGSGPRSGPMGALAQAADGSGIVTRQVWAGPDVDTFGAPSRDGVYLTFRDPESEDLAIRDLATGQKRRLTKHDSVWESAWNSVPSPDGKQVAYTWGNKGYDLRIVGLDGSKPRVLYRNPEVSWLQPTDWSPDGKNILAILNRRDRTNQIVLVSVLDGSVRVLKSSVSDDLGRPRFSPDGCYIAYYSPQQPGSREHDIFVLALDGGRDIPLVQHPAHDVAPDWAPDGKRILFRSNRTGTMGAWLIQVADGQPQGTPRLVGPGLENGTPMGFTRQGSYYYGVRTAMTDVYLAQLDLATGKLLAPPSPATQRFVGSNSRPDWSRDGRQLLFLSKRGPGAWGARALCVRSFESGAVRELVSKFDRVSWVRWSPDGRSLLAGALAGMYRIDVQTGDASPVPSSKGLGWPAVWSRDGKTIFYHRSDAKRMFIVARNLESGQEKELHSVAEPS